MRWIWTIVAIFAAVVLLPSSAEARKTRTVKWSGETWTVRHTYGKSNPGRNIFSDSARAVRVDAKRRLVLRLDRGKAVEVYGRERGYGTFTWSVASNLSNLDLWRVIGLFVWFPDGNEQDIEFARWGVSNAPVGWSVGWSRHTRANYTNFAVTSHAPYTVSLTWTAMLARYVVTDAQGTTLIDVSYPQWFTLTLGHRGLQPRMSHWLWPGVPGKRLSKRHRRSNHPVVLLNSFRFTPQR